MASSSVAVDSFGSPSPGSTGRGQGEGGLMVVNMAQLDALMLSRQGSRLLSRQASRIASRRAESAQASKRDSHSESSRWSRSGSRPTSGRGMGRSLGLTSPSLLPLANIMPSPMPPAREETPSEKQWRMGSRTIIREIEEDADAQPRSPMKLRFSDSVLSREQAEAGAIDPAAPSTTPLGPTPVGSSSLPSPRNHPSSSPQLKSRRESWPTSRHSSRAGSRPGSSHGGAFLSRFFSIGLGGRGAVAPFTPQLEDAIHAAKTGDEDVLVEWLKDNLDKINEKVEDSYTLLHLAAEEGQVGAVRTLLSLGASPAMVEEDQQTPLHIACAGGHLGVVQLLAPKGLPCPELLQEDKYQMTAWHLAIESGSSELVEYLMSAFPKRIDMRQRSGTALFMAKSNNLDSIASLLENFKAPGPSSVSDDSEASLDEDDFAKAVSVKATDATRRWAMANASPKRRPVRASLSFTLGKEGDGKEVRFASEDIARKASNRSAGSAGSRPSHGVGIDKDAQSAVTTDVDQGTHNARTQSAGCCTIL